MTSTWAHFKELCLLFKMSPSWGQKLNSFRRYELKKLPYPIWMAESGLYQQPPEKWNLKKRRSWKDFAFFCYGFYMGRTTQNHKESVCSPFFNIAVEKNCCVSDISHPNCWFIIDITRICSEFGRRFAPKLAWKILCLWTAIISSRKGFLFVGRFKKSWWIKIWLFSNFLRSVGFCFIYDLRTHAKLLHRINFPPTLYFRLVRITAPKVSID